MHSTLFRGLDRFANMDSLPTPPPLLHAQSRAIADAVVRNRSRLPGDAGLPHACGVPGWITDGRSRPSDRPDGSRWRDWHITPFLCQTDWGAAKEKNGLMCDVVPAAAPVWFSESGSQRHRAEGLTAGRSLHRVYRYKA